MVRRLGLLVLVTLSVCACSPNDPSQAPSQTTMTSPSRRAPTTTLQAGKATASTATATARGSGSESGTNGPIRHVFPIRGCRASYGRTHHDYPATDIFAPRGCAFVAPVDGMVDEVSRIDRWNPATDRGADRGGLSVSMVGVDGVRYYGSHLQSVAAGIAPGVRVAAGRLLGRVGNSGNARSVATHVHFGISWPTPKGIWWVRRGVLYPWPYLDSWREGGNLSPRSAVQQARAATGTPVPTCRSEC
jgi:murein DD-endopeptidase MepM/ murein hydrolase activator NlpD